jgi:SAM-dependent methyltransferase
MWLTMRPDVFDLHEFYGSRQGQLVRRLLNREIRAQWPDLHGKNVLGIGYASPFMRQLSLSAERVGVIMPKAQGVVRWPRNEPNLVALGQENDLPIEDRSIDRVLVVHALEATEQVGRLLREVWRILADGGEMIVIVPNRRGLWCLSERTPFGHGRPFSSTQLKQLLRGHLFAPKRTGFALCSSSLRIPPVDRSAGTVPSAGTSCSAADSAMPVLAGPTRAEHCSIPRRPA